MANSGAGWLCVLTGELTAERLRMMAAAEVFRGEDTLHHGGAALPGTGVAGCRAAFAVWALRSARASGLYWHRERCWTPGPKEEDFL